MENTKKASVLKLFLIEIKDRLFSSPKRIMKACGVLIMPLVYAFICSAAFWNPMAKIGQTPAALISLDQKQIILDGGTNVPLKSAPVEYSLIPAGAKYAVPQDTDAFATLYATLGNTATFYDETGHSIMKEQLSVLTPWSFASVVDDFMHDWKISMFAAEGLGYRDNHYTAKISDKLSLEKIDYISGDDVANYVSYGPDGWKNKESKYYMEINLPYDFTRVITNCEADPVNIATWIEPLRNEIGYFSTYQKNYFVGETLEAASPFIVGALLTSLLGPFISNTPLNPNSYIVENIPNGQFGEYGIGIGQMFICIGMWVGGFSMITLLDRKQRVKKSSAKKQYMSKTLSMWTISAVQSVVLFLALGLLGWFALGPVFLLEWFFMMLVGLIFMIIIQAIWYTFRDRTISMFFIVLFMVLNLSSGWGTFPTYMQFGLFECLSYILPFTYAIHAQGDIIYGIGSGTNLGYAWGYLFQCLGILIIFALVFYAWGLFVAQRRHRELLYGTYNPRKLAIIIKELGLNSSWVKNGLVVWTKIPEEENMAMKTKCLELFPYETKFSWHKNEEEIEDLEKFE